MSRGDNLKRRSERSHRHGTKWIFGMVCALLAGYGCAKDAKDLSDALVEQAPRAVRPPVTWDGSGRPVTSMMSVARAMEQPLTELVATQRLAFAPQGTPVGAGLVEPNQGELIRVQGSWRQVDVTEILHILLSEHLGRDYVLDPSLQGLMTLEIDEELTRADLMDLIGGIASVFNWSLEERGPVLFIRPGQRVARLANAPVLQANPAAPGDMAAVRVRRLRYVSPDQISTLLSSFASEGALVAHSGRMLVMADTTKQISRLSRLVAAIDVAPFQDAEIWTYRLASRDPEDAARLLETLIPVSGLTSGADPLAVPIAMPGTRRLMIVAKDASVQPIVGDILREIDRPTYGEARHRYIYRVQHFPTADLFNLVRNFFADRLSVQAPPGQAAALRADEGMSIQIDANSDILLIHATPTDYAELLRVLREVDRPPMQVDIQSIIAEVRLTNRLEFGVEYFLSNENSLGVLELTGKAMVAGTPTGSAFFLGGDGFAVVQALDNESEARVLSQPHLVLQDHGTSSIQVGGEVPVLRSSEGSITQTAGTSAIREEIEYRNTGVTLTIHAEINETGLVTLDITQEIRDALPTDIQNQPEFTTRTIETRVTVPHGQTVLLGGIISSNDQTSKTRIPLLGRLPVVGGAFSRTEDRVERTELVLAITPTIIAEPSHARRPLSAFLQSAHGVRSALRANIEDLPHGSLYEVLPDPRVPQEKAPADREEPSSRRAPANRERQPTRESAREVGVPSLLLNPYAALGRPPALSSSDFWSITAPTRLAVDPLSISLAGASQRTAWEIERSW